MHWWKKKAITNLSLFWYNWSSATSTTCYCTLEIMCVCVFPLSPCIALIRGMLIIVWLHGCPSSLGEEAETGEGCWEVRQHPAAGHLSCHLRYASHGIQCAPSGRQSWMPETEPHKLPPFLITLHLNTMQINKTVGVLTFFQIFCTNMKRRELRCTQSERVSKRSVYNCNCRRLILGIVCTGLCIQSLYLNVFSVIHQHTFFT